MDSPLRILMLEDNSTDAEIIQRLLRKELHAVIFHMAINKQDFLQALETFNPQVIVADHSLPQFNASEALQLFKEKGLNVPFILVTGTVSEEFAADIIKQGADDYILKDRLIRLPAAIENVLKQKQSEKEKQEAWQQLLESNKKLRALSGHLQNIREEERKRISREIHDQLGQQLSAMKMDITSLNKIIPATEISIKERLDYIASTLDGTVKMVRRIASELRPILLDNMGLIAALEWQLKDFGDRSGNATTFHCDIQEPALPDNSKINLFRILQESLTNISRHAKAKNVDVFVKHNNNDLELTIQDDGIGFNKKEVRSQKTLGLLGIQERTYMIGGTYNINSEPGKGTIVTILVPLAQGG